MRAFRNGLIGVFALFALACGGGGGGGGGAPLPAPDTTAPLITNLSVEPSLLTVGTNARIRASVTDDRSGVASVQATLIYPDNTQASVSLSFTQGVYQGDFQAQWNGVAGRVRVQLRAVDGAGNITEREITVNAAGNPPQPPF